MQHEIQRIGLFQLAVLALFVVVMVPLAQHQLQEAPVITPSPEALATTDAPTGDTVAGDDCTVPEWAIKIGHADKWKLHHNCK